MNKKIKTIIKSFFVIALFASSIHVFAKWIDSSVLTGTPPNTSPAIPEPINTGSAPQEKINGDLWVRGFGVRNAAIFDGASQPITISATACGLVSCNGKVLTSDSNGVGTWQAPSGSVALSALLPAVAPNTIDNSDATNKSFTQEWQWNKLGIAQTGLRLSSTATTTDNNAKLLESAFKGSQNLPSKTYAGYFTNTNTGSSNINYAGYFSASNSNIPTNNKNYAIVVPSGGGNVGIGTVTPSALLHLGAGTASIAPLKFTTSAGVLTSPLQDGAMEYDGAHLYITIGAVRSQLDGQNVTDPWTSTGKNVYLVTPTNSVGIGIDTPSQQLEITKSFKLPDTIDSTTGVIYKGNNPFIHNFGTDNTFLGVNAGNFLMTGWGQNTGIGTNALNANTTGYENVAVGSQAMALSTKGRVNVAVGFGALGKSTGDSTENVVVGWNALGSANNTNFSTVVGADAVSRATGSVDNTTAIGYQALHNLDKGAQNVAVGYQALFNVTGTGGDAHDNLGLGNNALQNVVNGNNNIGIGNNAGPANPTSQSTISIGNNAHAPSDYTVQIGDGTIKNNYFSGNIETTGGFRQNNTTAPQTCTASINGMTWFISNSTPGVQDTYKICAQKAGVYDWQKLY